MESTADTLLNTELNELLLPDVDNDPDIADVVPVLPLNDIPN